MNTDPMRLRLSTRQSLLHFFVRPLPAVLYASPCPSLSQANGQFYGFKEIVFFVCQGFQLKITTPLFFVYLPFQSPSVYCLYMDLIIFIETYEDEVLARMITHPATPSWQIFTRKKSPELMGTYVSTIQGPWYWWFHRYALGMSLRSPLAG